MLTSDSMRWRAGAMRQSLTIVAIVALGVLPTAPSRAVGAPACPALADAQVTPNLADLRQTLGGVMGSPVSCPVVDAEGHVIQVTTTGLALVDPGSVALFASGENHWALTAQGLETWTGSWHNGLYPAVPAVPQQDETDATADSAAQVGSVEAMTVVRAPQTASNSLVVQDLHGSMITLETASGCADLVAAPGDHVFIRSSGPWTDLIVLQQHATCPVAEMRTAAGD